MFWWGREWDVVWVGGVGWLGDGGVKSGLRRLCVVCATTENCCKCNIFIQNHAPGQSWLTPPITPVNGGIWRYIILKITKNDIENHISRHLKARFTATHYVRPRFAYYHHAPPPTTSHHFTTLNHYYTTILPRYHIIILIL